MISKAVVGALALAGGGLIALPVQAETIYIGLQETGTNGGAITQVKSGVATTGPSFIGSYGTFHITDATGLDVGTPTSPNFGSNILVATGAQTASHTITIYVTETGITGGLPTTFNVGLTANFLSAGWTATETVYENNNNSKFGTTTSLFSSPFTATNTAESTNGTDKVTTDTPYSITEVYTITTAVSSTAAKAQLTESTFTTVIPEPSTWAMMVLGFIGLGYAAFRRNSKARATAI
jgi:hypothetical protein